MIVVCGEALFDVFQIGQTADGGLQFEARVGGSPFNVAVGIARLDGRAALLTGMSNDLLGTRLFDRLAAEGVDTGCLVRNDRRTTLSLVGLDATGQPDYAFYGAGSADCALTPADLPVLPDDTSALHFGSYSIAVAPVADALAALAAANRGKFISLDPNIRPTIEPDMRVWQRRIDVLRDYADLIKVSAEDLGILYPDRTPEQIAEAWIANGATCVIVTDGAARITVHRAGRVDAVEVEPTDVVDTVGAGDAFQASLLASLQARGQMSVHQNDLPDADLIGIVRQASRAAAIVCGRRGADLPTRQDLQS